MTSTCKITFLLLSLAPFLAHSCQQQDRNADVPPMPNIVFIMADDMGYAEAGCYGQEIIRTPGIDRLAEQGMKFTRFYAGSPVCAPSRCTLLTGKHTGHSFIRDNYEIKEAPTEFNGQMAIPDSIVTIAEILKSRGYATACIGKWGLGHTGTAGDPVKQGFDLFYGYKCQVHAHNHYPRFLWRNDSMEVLEGNDRTLYGKQHSQDLFTSEAIHFINEKKDTAFFLYLPFIIPHLSIQTTEPFLNMYKDSIPEAVYTHTDYLRNPYPRAAYAGMISQLDDAVGKIIGEIERLGLDKETIIFFTSDNGPTYNRLGGSDSDYFKSSGLLKGRKGDLYEGGIRVPMIVRWTGKIKPGTICGDPYAFWDILPTLCQVSGCGVPDGLDGISILPVLTGSDRQEEHASLYWEFPDYGGQATLTEGDWKLLVRSLNSGGDSPSIQLFNLGEDTGESTDLSGRDPERVQAMIRDMKQSRFHSDQFPFPALEAFYDAY